MWKLKHISARNVCSFRELEYSPTQGVTTLIFGYNADNESQQSNGSGKSTLIEAIALGITGAPLRKVRTEEIINDAAEECSVRLHFENEVTHEELHIEREIFRKGASGVRCTLHRGGESEPIVQASVDAYNKYILETLGVTRDELFSSFILSRHRYGDFLSSSDTQKKEIINRFSNGVLVDQAIGKIREDIAPADAALKEAELEFASLEGRIEMLTEQIHCEEDSRQQKQSTLQERIAVINSTIIQKRNVIRACIETVAKNQKATSDIKTLDKQLEALEDSDEALDACICGVGSLLHPLAPGKLTDWTTLVDKKKHEVAQAQEEFDKWSVVLGRTSEKISNVEREYKTLHAEAEAFVSEYEDKRAELTSQMTLLNDRLSAANATVGALKGQKTAVAGAIEGLGAKLAGTIQCPSCGHEFLVSDKEFDVENARQDLEHNRQTFDQISRQLLDGEQEVENVEMMKNGIRCEGRVLVSHKEEWDEKIAKAQRALQSTQYEMEGYKFNMSKVQELVAAHSQQIDKLREKVFEEAYTLLDTMTKGYARAITEANECRNAARSSVATLQQTVEEMNNTSGEELLASLLSSLKTYRQQSSEVLVRKTDIEGQLSALQQQEQVFMQFKSFLANTKIDALASMMNRVLADLGSDLRVNLSGYTTLKTGTMREKIAVTITRDGVDAGSFGKFSEGEKARINLASIVAMQRLVNGNCDLGKGLDLILIDEVIDSMDADGLASVFTALNKLGITALVVSHGAVAESYRHRLLIAKRNGESSIDG